LPSEITFMNIGKVLLCANILLAIALASTPIKADTYTWNLNANGNWDNPANWNPNTGFPNAVGDVANLTNNITGANRIITMDTDITLGIMNMGDPLGTPWRAFILETTN